MTRLLIPTMKRSARRSSQDAKDDETVRHAAKIK
jgi:hypothetical protein